MIETATLVDYWESGYLAAAGDFTSDEVGAWRDECDRLLGPESSAAGVGDIVERSPTFAALAHDPRVHELVGHLFGHAGALLDAALLTRPPGGAAARLQQVHHRYDGFGIPADQMLTAVVAIDPVGPATGAIELLPARHRPRHRTPSHSPLDSVESVVDLSQRRLVGLDAGQLLVLHSRTPHRYLPRPLAAPRRTLHLTYVVDPIGGAYERHRAWRR